MVSRGNTIRPVRLVPKKRRSYNSGKPKEVPYPIDFELDGIIYVCKEQTPLQLSEMMRMQGLPADSDESMAFIANVFRSLLGNEYNTFLNNVGKFSTRIEVFVEIIQGIFQDINDRDASEIPTIPQSDYSDGLRTTDSNSTEDYSARAMRLLKDRPDLQVAILRAKEA